MKLLVLSHLFPNKSFPSFGVFVMNQLLQLAGLEAQIEVIAPVPFSPKVISGISSKWRLYSQIERTRSVNNMKIYYPRYLRLPGRWFRPFAGRSMYFSIIAQYRNLFSSSSFDVILANSITPDGEVAVQLGKQLGIPSACYAIGDDIISYPHESPRMLRKTQFILQNLNGVICHGTGLKKMVEEMAPGVQDITTIYRGINLERFYSDPLQRRKTRQQLGFKDDAFIFLFVGYLEKRKGLFEIMNVFPELFKKYNHIYLLFIGDIVAKAEFQPWISRPDIASRANYIGTVNHSQIPAYMNAADAFLLPSLWEGTPNAIAEAAACGLPIVTTNIPGAHDLLGEKYKPFLVEPGNENDLFEKASHVIESETLRRQMSSIAIDRIRKYFDAQQNARRLKEYLQNLILKNQKAGC
ncbi:MAG: glycosyltransferase family 4 protein [Calditrichaeota bacterium]|nr:MAG: glycosyltransferase family 4 protein [Calditrichota bacterium]